MMLSRSVLIVQGAFEDIYEPAWHRALTELDIKNEIYLTHSQTLPWIFGRIERRILWGPGITKIRKNLIQKIKKDRPDITLLYQGHYFDRETIEQIRSFTFVTGYHNDDPFGSRKILLRYRLMLPALSLYHGFHVYRQCNVEEARAYGIQNVRVLMPYYLPWLDYPQEMNSSEWKNFGCDVVFAGHAENDIRVNCLTEAFRSGFNFRLYGEERFWKPILPDDVYHKAKPIRKVTGEEYRKALCGAKIAICFLSKWNRDQYTRRSFEIPSCGVFMLSERTPTMQDLYKEGEEAEFFSSVDEFMDKLKYYLNNDSDRNRIAAAGFKRATTSGHDIYSRMQQWLRDVTEWKENQRLST